MNNRDKKKKRKEVFQKKEALKEIDISLELKALSIHGPRNYDSQ